jgi:hypothetical protein
MKPVISFFPCGTNGGAFFKYRRWRQTAHDNPAVPAPMIMVLVFSRRAMAFWLCPGNLIRRPGSLPHMKISFRENLCECFSAAFIASALAGTTMVTLL